MNPKSRGESDVFRKTDGRMRLPACRALPTSLGVSRTLTFVEQDPLWTMMNRLYNKFRPTESLTSEPKLAAKSSTSAQIAKGTCLIYGLSRLFRQSVINDRALVARSKACASLGHTNEDGAEIWHARHDGH
jgi:hypothetical protein